MLVLGRALAYATLTKAVTADATIHSVMPHMHLLGKSVKITMTPPDGDPHLLGLYVGIPLTSRDWGYGGVLPDRITIFRNAILRMCTTEDEVVVGDHRVEHVPVGGVAARRLAVGKVAADDAHALEIAAPIPRLPPVTTATRPIRSS